MTLKDYVAKRIDAFKKDQAERRGFQRILEKKIKVARRKAFAEEAIKQAAKQSEQKAKAKFNPQQHKSIFGNTVPQKGLDFALNFGTQKKTDKKFDPMKKLY